jgi:hypothetical protein
MEIEYATENELTPDHDRFENKSETKQVLNDLMTAFEQFKQANDQRLDTIEKHQSVDVLVNDKVDRKTWQLGVATDTSRYGNEIGYQQGSTVTGLSGQPQVYYAPTPVVVKPVSGQFGSGKIHLRLYSLTFSLPGA